MPDFHSLEVAQRWLDQNRGRRWANVLTWPWPIGKCLDDCQREASMCEIDQGEWNNHLNTVRFRMAARRLSNALAVHHPQMFG